MGCLRCFYNIPSALNLEDEMKNFVVGLDSLGHPPLLPGVLTQYFNVHVLYRYNCYQVLKGLLKVRVGFVRKRKLAHVVHIIAMGQWNCAQVSKLLEFSSTIGQLFSCFVVSCYDNKESTCEILLLYFPFNLFSADIF